MSDKKGVEVSQWLWDMIIDHLRKGAWEESNEILVYIHNEMTEKEKAKDKK